MFYPLIELMDGKAVFFDPAGGSTVESAEPIELAAALHRYGTIVVLDRDASSGQGGNQPLITELCRRFETIVGGGIRTIKEADHYLRAGADKIILGVTADPDLISRFPMQRVLLALDRRPGPVGIEDWRVPEGFDPTEHSKTLRHQCSGVVYGLDGTELGHLITLQSQVEIPVLSLGVVRSEEDITDLDRSEVDCLLDGAMRKNLDPAEAFASLLDFDSGSGLLPTIIQDKSGQVLGLFYSSREAVAQSLRSGQATFWSFARGEVSVKESTQGQTLPLITSALDCRRRSLLYTVQSTGPVCHRGTYSCFGDRRFSLETLEEVIVSRQSKPKAGSYTQQVLTSSQGVTQELLRQAQELAQADSPAGIIWETADLLYFVLVNLARNGIALSDVMKELRGRAGRRRQ